MTPYVGSEKSRVQWAPFLRGVDEGPMGCRWGADEACLRALAGPMRRGFVDALDR